MMRSWYGTGKPKAAHERLIAAILTTLTAIQVRWDDGEAECAIPSRWRLATQRGFVGTGILRGRRKLTV